MSLVTCNGCNKPFTHAGYSRHLSMTALPNCHAIYNGRLDRTIVNDPPGDSGPEDTNSSKCIC